MTSQAARTAASGTAAVTEAAGGIGEVTCRRLAADGFAVAGLDLREPGLSEVPGARSYGVDECDARRGTGRRGRYRLRAAG